MRNPKERFEETLENSGIVENAHAVTEGLGRFAWVVAGTVMGMGLMYILDPSMGRRRRAALIDRTSELKDKVAKPIRSMVHRAESRVENARDYLQ